MGYQPRPSFGKSLQFEIQASQKTAANQAVASKDSKVTTLVKAIERVYSIR